MPGTFPGRSGRAAASRKLDSTIAYEASQGDGAGRAQRVRLRRPRPRLRQAGGRGNTGHCRCPGGRTHARAW